MPLGHDSRLGLRPIEALQCRISEWFPSDQDLADIVKILRSALDRLDDVGRDRLDQWLGSQLEQDGSITLV